MDRARVAEFYRAKGYTVREAVLATGHSGNGHRVPLLCEGPLGNLAIFFGDAGGVDGHEMGGARRVAKDLGATAIMAAPSFTNTQRGEAAELGVVLLDADAIAPEASAPVPMPRRPWPDMIPTRASLTDDFAAHPWPDSGRPGGRDGPQTTTFEVDDLLRDLDRPLRTAPAPATAEPQISQMTQNQERSAQSAKSVVASAAPTESLWRNQRRSDSLVLRPAVVRTPSGTAKFAWLGLPAQPTPAPTPIEIELEHSDVLHARQAAAEVAAVEPLSPHELAYRALRRKVWIRRAAWIGGTGLFAYLFLLWWL